MLNVQCRNLGTVSLLNLQGQVVIGETGVLSDIIQTLPTTSAVLVDLSRVTLMDAHGLGVMLQLREQAQARGMRLELTNIRQRVHELLRITRLDSVFKISSGVGLFPLLTSPQRTAVAA